MAYTNVICSHSKVWSVIPKKMDRTVEQFPNLSKYTY